MAHPVKEFECRTACPHFGWQFPPSRMEAWGNYQCFSGSRFLSTRRRSSHRARYLTPTHPQIMPPSGGYTLIVCVPYEVCECECVRVTLPGPRQGHSPGEHTSQLYHKHCKYHKHCNIVYAPLAITAIVTVFHMYYQLFMDVVHCQYVYIIQILRTTSVNYSCLLYTSRCV